MQDGRLQPGDFGDAEDDLFISFLRGGGANQQHIFGADATTSVTQAQANIEGRRALLRLLRFVQSCPAAPAPRSSSSSGAAVRETTASSGRRRSPTTITSPGRCFDDAAATASTSSTCTSEHGVEQPDRVPRRNGCPLPLSVHSCRRKPPRSLRAGPSPVTASPSPPFAWRPRMAMGQAAGAAAALGVRCILARRPDRRDPGAPASTMHRSTRSRRKRGLTQMSRDSFERAVYQAGPSASTPVEALRRPSFGDHS